MATSSRQFIEQRLRILKIGAVKALGEPAGHGLRTRLQCFCGAHDPEEGQSGLDSGLLLDSREARRRTPFSRLMGATSLAGRPATSPTATKLCECTRRPGSSRTASSIYCSKPRGWPNICTKLQSFRKEDTTTKSTRPRNFSTGSKSLSQARGSSNTTGWSTRNSNGRGRARRFDLAGGRLPRGVEAVEDRRGPACCAAIWIKPHCLTSEFSKTSRIVSSSVLPFARDVTKADPAPDRTSPRNCRDVRHQRVGGRVALTALG